MVGQHTGIECANLPGVQGAGPGAERMEIDLLEVVFVYHVTSAEDRALKKDKKIYIYRPACIHDIAAKYQRISLFSGSSFTTGLVRPSIVGISG